MDVLDRYAFIHGNMMDELKDFGLPKTVDAAVDLFTRHMTSDDKQALRETKSKDLIMLHHTLGQWIRNNFGLWTDNKELLESSGKDHPDDASGVIIRKIWEKVNGISDSVSRG